LTNFHKVDIFQSSINNPLGGGEDISSFQGKKPGAEANHQLPAGLILGQRQTSLTGCSH
jgi:hypothetical protein